MKKTYTLLFLALLSYPIAHGWSIRDIFGGGQTASTPAKELSIQDLINQKKIQINGGRINLSNMGITNLEGLQNIPKYLSIDPTAIKIIDLSHNHISNLKEKYFEKFKNLEELNLSHNKIKQIIDDALEDNKKLRILDLSYNQISKLTRDAFNDLHSLIKLNLSNNMLTNFTNALLHDTQKQIDVMLQGNKIPQKTLDKIKGKLRDWRRN